MKNTKTFIGLTSNIPVPAKLGICYRNAQKACGFGSIKPILMKDLPNGTKVTSNKLNMIITGKSTTAYLGYIMYKDQPVGQCTLLFKMFDNPHYKNDLQITLPKEA